MTSGGTTHTFAYDPDGRMIGEYGTSATDVIAETIWLSPEVAANDNQPLGGDDGAGGYAPLAVVTGSGASTALYWVHGNHLGVPIVTTDAGGAVASPTGFTMVGFPGQTRTLADLYYNRYRDYDSSTGRYIQADPVGLEGGSNPYAYAENNPLKFTDPMGLAATSQVIEFGAKWWLQRQARPGRATPIGRAWGIGEAIGTAAAVGVYLCTQDDDEDSCEVQRREDELECNQWHVYGSRQGYAICMRTAATRYGECRARGGPSEITTPLYLPTGRRGIPDPTRRRSR